MKKPFLLSAFVSGFRIVSVLALFALTGCASRERFAAVEVSRMHGVPPLPQLSVERTFFVDLSGDSALGKAAHARFCKRVEKELIRHDWRLETKERAVFRVECNWKDVEWQRVNRAARAPMSRLWYLGSVYDPQGEVYALPGKTGKYRPQRCTLAVGIGFSRATPAASRECAAFPLWSAACVQSGGEAGKEPIARLVNALVECRGEVGDVPGR